MSRLQFTGKQYKIAHTKTSFTLLFKIMKAVIEIDAILTLTV